MHSFCRHQCVAVIAAVIGATPAHAASVNARDEAWDPPRLVPLEEGQTLPTPEELEARGARIGKFLVKVYDIFDPGDPREDNWAYRTANTLHYKTRRLTIRDQIILEPGEPLVARRLAEAERLLRRRDYLFDAVVRVARYDAVANVADIEVSVRDVWTLNPGISYSNKGGESSTGFELEEQNLFGRGINLQLSYDKDVDRTSEELRWIDPNVLGSRWALSLRYADLSDGSTEYVDVERPFYSFDTRWSLGATWFDDSRIETRYDLGEPVDSLNVDRRLVELRYGFSTGLDNGLVRRWLFGLRSDEQSFLAVPDEVAPAVLPPDQKFVYPWIGVEWVEDAFEKTRNRNQIGRTEDAYRGTSARFTLGYSDTGFGADDDALLFTGAFGAGREYRAGREWSLVSGTSGRLEQGKLVDAVLSAEARHYWHVSRRRTIYAAFTGVVTEELDPDRQLLLGGEEGLRGYPLRYQTGTASALLTLEQRWYTDWYPFRLFHIGGAVFFDTGRTWGPTLSGEPPRGWLSDVGLGLRIGNSRSGLGSVVHVDFSYALDAIPGKDRFQVTVETKRSF